MRIQGFSGTNYSAKRNNIMFGKFDPSVSSLLKETRKAISKEPDAMILINGMDKLEQYLLAKGKTHLYLEHVRTGQSSVLTKEFKGPTQEFLAFCELAMVKADKLSVNVLKYIGDKENANKASWLKGISLK